MDLELRVRFLAAFEELQKMGLVKDQASFAEKIKITKAMFTDIKKGRTQPGFKAVRGIVQSFPTINPDWMLTGEGSMLRAAPYTLNDDSSPGLEAHEDLPPYGLEKYTSKAFVKVMNKARQEEDAVRRNQLLDQAMELNSMLEDELSDMKTEVFEMIKVVRGNI